MLKKTTLLTILIVIVLFSVNVSHVATKVNLERETVKEELRGKHLMITGRVTKNEMFDRLEFIAHDIAVINPKTLLAEIH